MGLHKNLLVDRANLPAELICSLCTHILLQPYQVFCSQDHVFCQACLDSYVEDCIADHSSATEETEPVTVACPECSRMQEPPERLRVSAFRPAKFVQRIISSQTIRCPTTMARSCQWTGPMEDVESHLGVCGFAVEYHCPHHQFGCSFRGTVIDLVAHMPACLFCAEDRSIETTHSADLDTSYIGQLPSPSKGPPSPPRSSPILDSLHSHVDQTHNPVQAQKPSPESEHSPIAQIAIDEFDQDEFSGLLEDMDMTDTTDLTISHGPTLLPVCFQGLESDQELVHDQDQGFSQEVGEVTFSEMQPGRATVPPTPYPRRRRRIIEEHTSQTTNEEEENDISDGPKTTAETNQDINTYSARPVAQSPTRSRVLQEIPTPLPDCSRGSLPGSGTYDYVGSSQQNDPHNQMPRRLKLRLKLRQPRSPSSSLPIPQPTAVDRRVLQFQASWPWEVHRRPRSSLSDPDESSPIVTIADISTVASPVSVHSLSPSSPTSKFAGFASMTRHTIAGPSYSAESHAFLPLHTHEPRYLRSRRRKVLRGITYSGSPLLSVHPAYERSRGKLWTEPITPDITSPEDLVQ